MRAESRADVCSTHMHVDTACPAMALCRVVASAARALWIADLLPRYNRLFAHAGRTYDFPSAFIAAVAYIESKWRPRARHHGAAGMMMLSSATARTVGVADRLSAAESVRGGASADLARRAPARPQLFRAEGL